MEEPTYPKQQQQQSSSPLSSPSHEFSFTITLHPSPKRCRDALDLAPADDIFFHGRLLPLHLLPRPSTDTPLPPANSILRSDDERKKSNSFSSLSRLTRWFEDKKKKKAFHIKNFFSLLFTSSSSPSKSTDQRERRDLKNRRPYSFAGRSNVPRERDKWMKRRGEFSAPASMRTSPSNSGLLLATPSGYASSNESSMDELHNAIQAAIAHCKSSTAATSSKENHLGFISN